MEFSAALHRLESEFGHSSISTYASHARVGNAPVRVPEYRRPDTPALRWRSDAVRRILRGMDLRFDHTDFSVVVKNRAPPPKAWRWEIYRAGRASPVEYSSIYYETMTEANKAGKAALKQFLSEFPD